MDGENRAAMEMLIERDIPHDQRNLGGHCKRPSDSPVSLDMDDRFVIPCDGIRDFLHIDLMGRGHEQRDIGFTHFGPGHLDWGIDGSSKYGLNED